MVVLKKSKKGVVISANNNKTITVLVKKRTIHPLYKKTIVKTSKIMVHDENNECSNGDEVQIVECRHLSKKKSWRLKSKIVKKE